MISAYWLKEQRNWGDIFTPYLLRHFGVEVEFAPAEDADLFCCGTVGDSIPDGFTGHILGSGIGHAELYKDFSHVSAPLLLRGGLTASRCKTIIPARYGDPAILSHLFAPGLTAEYKYGIIPHYVDKNHGEIAWWSHSKGALVIDIESGIEKVIRQIASCERIVSSSLHGLVIADSLGIPSRWVKLSAKVEGKDFKFYDYYSVYGTAPPPASSITSAFGSCRIWPVEPSRIAVIEAFQEYAEKVR